VLRKKSQLYLLDKQENQSKPIIVHRLVALQRAAALPILFVKIHNLRLSLLLYASRGDAITHQKHNGDAEAEQAQAEEYEPDDTPGIICKRSDSEAGPGDA
jgi:hypothetical protein